MNTLFLKKLKQMRFEELSFRLKTSFEKRLDLWCYTLKLGQNPEIAWKSPKEKIVFSYPWLETEDQAEGLQELQRSFPEYVEKITQAADRICHHAFTFFEATFQFDKKIPWSADPVSGKTWDPVFHSKVKIFDGNTGNGDVKYVWELNRHQFIPILGKAYALTKNEDYAQEGLTLMLDWIETNPYQIGINWASALEVSVRVLSWCWATAFFEESPHFTDEKRQVILRAIYQHGLFIEKHLSFFFSPYNHLIGEATALFVIGNLFPILKPASHWHTKGWQILENEMEKQFHPDGGTVEQATGYHHFTMGFYLQAILLKKQSGKVSPDIWNLFEKSFEYTLYMNRPDGEIPMMGDGDEGKALTLHQPSLWDFRPFLMIGAALFQRGDFKKMAGDFSPDTLWLIGKKAWQQYNTLQESPPKETSKALMTSGYYLMRTGWDKKAHYLVFDGGALADGVHPDEIPSAAHGHADALSIEVTAWGYPFLIDPGFYTYNGAVEWHRYFRETAAHNTVVVDGQSQAKYRGRLTWSHAPTVVVSDWLHTKAFDAVSGTQSGYENLPDPVFHQRSVLFLKPDYWLIRDLLDAKKEHQIDRYFHFNAVSLLGDEATQAVKAQSPENASERLALLPCETTKTEMKIIQKGTNPDEGWIAPGYGLKIHAPIVRYRTEAKGPVALHTLIIPFRAKMPKLVIETILCENEDASQCGGFIISKGSRSDLVLFSRSESLRCFSGNNAMDGSLAAIRRDETGAIISALLIKGSVLKTEGNVLFKLHKKIDFVTLSVEGNEVLIETSEPIEVSSPFPNTRVVVSPPNNIGSD